MLTLDEPEGVNGIVDYMSQLMPAIAAQGIDVAPLVARRWGLAGLQDLRRALRRLRPDVVHLQHPIVFPGRSYVPQILANLSPGVVTTHGGSSYGTLWGKVSLGPFMLRTRHLVFTTEFERDHALRWASWMRGRSSVIPIGSNIPARPAPTREPGLVVTFGLVRPQKGLEDVIAVARLAHRSGGLGLRFQVIGQAPRSDGGYAERLRASAAGLPIEWLGELDREAAARALGRASVALLPFPDGASERRGSLLACLTAETPVITTPGPQCPPSLAEAVRLARPMNGDLAAGLLQALSDVLSNEPEWRRLSLAGAAHARRSGWEQIARRHVALYGTLAGRPESAR